MYKKNQLNKNTNSLNNKKMKLIKDLDKLGKINAKNDNNIIKNRHYRIKMLCDQTSYYYNKEKIKINPLLQKEFFLAIKLF